MERCKQKKKNARRLESWMEGGQCWIVVADSSCEWVGVSESFFCE